MGPKGDPSGTHRVMFKSDLNPPPHCSRCRKMHLLAEIHFLIARPNFSIRVGSLWARPRSLGPPLDSLGTRVQRAQGPKAQGSMGAHRSIGAHGSIGPMGPMGAPWVSRSNMGPMGPKLIYDGFMTWRSA